MKPGIHLVHKPVGVTSFSVVQALRTEKLPMCHGGTLDPFAEGLLLLLAGAATKAMDLLHALPKRYEAEVAWGAETDTGDGGGRVVERGDAASLDPERLSSALAGFVGWTEQVPPATSAKKVDGEPAYKKAHRGEAVVLPPSRVYLHEARWLSHDLPRSSRLALCCRGGFYVRALARDVGRAVGARAHVTALRRTEIGPWRDPAGSERPWIHGEAAFPWWPTRALSDDDAYALKQGRTIPKGTLGVAAWALPPGFPPPQALVAAAKGGKVVALLELSGPRLSQVLRLPGGL